MMRWRLKFLVITISILGVQLVFLGLCYRHLASFSAVKYGAPNDNEVAGLNGFRSAREIPGVTQKQSASITWLQDITSASVVSALSEKKPEDVKENTQNVLTTTDKEAAYVQTASNSSLVDVSKGQISKDRLRRLNPSTMLPHSEAVDDFRSVAERERRKTLEWLREVRIQEQKRIEDNYRRNAAEKRARRDAEEMKVKEAEDEKRKKKLKTIPMMERERSERLHKLWEEKKGIKSEETFDKFEARFEGDPLRTSLSEFFEEVCESRVEPLVECSNRTKRMLNESEAEGVDILFSMRTTVKYHEERLPLLFETWLSEVDPANVYVVTDDDDEDLTWKLRTLRMNYVNTQTGSSHNISDLCCKAGVEMELMFAPENSKFNWLCHVDDDMYVNLKPLIDSLSRFDPVKEKIYLGRSGSLWEQAREVKEDSGLGRPGQRYHFAVGGMYCLSRAMMTVVKEYLSGCEAFRKSCLLAREPEDVTVGLVVGAVLGLHLQRTEMIFSHGLDLLSAVPSANIRDQIAFSYGLGSENFRSMIPNVIYVPGGVYNLDEDNTQFRSLHCYLHPEIDWCMEKRKQVLQERKRREASNSKDCVCSWKGFICCQIYKDNHRRYMLEKKKEERKKRMEAKKRKEEHKPGGKA